MKAIYLHNQKFGKKYEVVSRDARINLNGDYQTTEYRMVIENGEIENLVVAHDDKPRMVLHFFDSEKGRMVSYRALTDNNGLTGNVEVPPGVYSVDEYLEKFGSAFNVRRVYGDGQESSGFSFYPRNKMLVFSNGQKTSESDGLVQADAIYKLDTEQGIVSVDNAALRGDHKVLPVKELKSLSDVEPHKPVRVVPLQQQSIQNQKLAVLAGLASLTEIQQRDVLAAALARIELHQNNRR